MSKTVSVTPEIKGWCPGALRPMMSGDGLVVRVRTRGGRLMPDQLRAIAALSSQYGNGLIDLSARANVQLRGVTVEHHPALIAGLAGLGLIDASAQAESRRNILVTPFWDQEDGTAALAEALMQALADEAAPQTPGKFGYAIDCGPTPVLQDCSADIRIERDATGALLVRADGADRGVQVTTHTASAVALDLARWFLETGGAPQGRGRMAAHLRQTPLPARFATHPALLNQIETPRPGPCAQGYLVGFEFGQMQAETVSVLAEFGTWRVTPWRMVLIEGLAEAPRIDGLITRADDPRLNVIACTGAPGCPQGLSATRPLARELAGHVPGLLHVSGCAKGCAHPSPAPLTLVARADGRFDLIRNGTAADEPIRTGLTQADLTQNPHFLTE